MSTKGRAKRRLGGDVYLPRTVDKLLDDYLPQASAIALDGAKGVGKTGTALQRTTHRYLLDRADQRALVAANPDGLLTPGTTLLDEWSRMPEVWDLVRRSVDDGAPPGSFLLTGSATPATAQGTHSGAGRILSLRMRPMALHERGEITPAVSVRQLFETETPCSGEISGETSFTLPDYLEAIEASGFPGMMGLGRQLRSDQLSAYVQRVIDRDLPDAGYAVRRPEALRRWLAAYAAASSTTTAYSKLLNTTTAGDGSQPTRDTTLAYRDHLTQLWLLDPVPGWSPSGNPFTRLQQAPKHQLVDPALAATLLRATAASMMTPRSSHLAGPLFESLATLTVRVAAEAIRAHVGHLRTRNGDHEIDLVVEGRDGRIVACEVKLAAAVADSDVRHLLWLREQLPDDVSDLVVITTGTHAYRRGDGVAVVPLALLGP